MHVTAEIKKWGNSLALRITGVMAEVPKFKPGTQVSVEVTEEGLVVKPVSSPGRAFRLPYSESDLIKGLDSTSAHADELAVPIGKELGD